jgi:hypothetical protein
MSARTITLCDGREAQIVPADKAGEFMAVVVCRDLVEQLHASRLLTWRQAEALSVLRRVRKAAGYRAAWERPAGLGERPDQVEEAAKAELAELLHVMREPTRTQIMHMLATDEWQVTARVSAVQDAADALADRLKLAKPEKPK